MIDGFFKALNFCLFIALVTYYWRKNLAKIFQSQLARKRAAKENIAQQKHSIVVEEQSLKNHTGFQKSLYATLSQKVTIWHQAQEAEHAAAKKMYSNNMQRLQDRIEQELQAHRDLQLKQLIINQALADSATELEKVFEDPIKAQAYNQLALKALAQKRES